MKNLLLFAVLSFTTSIFTQVELKLNIPTLAIGIPNIGLEFQVGENSSIQLDALGSFWDTIEGAPLHINQTFLEYRLYSKSNISEWFVGAHIGCLLFRNLTTLSFIQDTPIQVTRTEIINPGVRYSMD